jgi:hypothetical protein
MEDDLPNHLMVGAKGDTEVQKRFSGYVKASLAFFLLQHLFNHNFSRTHKSQKALKTFRAKDRSKALALICWRI